MKRLLLLMLVVFSGRAVEQTNKTVIPAQSAAEEGGAAFAAFSGSVPEFQQLFRASALAANWGTPVKITGMSFRVNGMSGSFDAVVPRIEIRFSTSARVPETMQTSYAANRGADERLVYSQSNVSLFSADGAAPRAFDLALRFDEPFVYDTRAGSLLMHFSHEGLASPQERSIDAEGFPTISSSPFGFFAPGVTGVPIAYGAIAQFEWVAIPEPKIFALVAMGLTMILKTKRKGLNHVSS